jgi:hypothetical protein
MSKLKLIILRLKVCPVFTMMIKYVKACSHLSINSTVLFRVLTALYSLLTCRVILNIRGAATSLHEFSEVDHMTPMQFAVNSQRGAARGTEFTVSSGINSENA